MRPSPFIFFGLLSTAFPVLAKEIPAAPVPTAPSSTDELTIEQLVEMAKAKNPRGTIALEFVNAARERAKGWQAWPNPWLQMTPGFSGSNMARDEEVIVSQPVDIFGLRRARYGVASAEIKRAEAEGDLALRSLSIEVRSAAIGLFAAQEIERLEQTQVELAQAFRDAAARKAELGDVPPVQVQRAELELQRRQNDFANAQVQRQLQLTALNNLVSETPDAPLRVASPIGVDELDLLRASKPISPPSTTRISSQIAGDLLGNIGRRPDILSAEASVAARRAIAETARRDALPTVQLQARRSAFFGRDGSTALRAVVTLPLFDFGTIRGQKRAAQAEARSLEASLELLKRQASNQVQSARLRLQQSRQNTERYQGNLLPLALELLRKSQVGYTAGASTQLEVLEAQRTLRQLQSEYLQALIGLSNAEIALDAALNGGAITNQTRIESNLLESELGGLR